MMTSLQRSEMITFKNNIGKYQYINDKYGMGHVCLRCGSIFGKHSGVSCPSYTKKDEFLLKEELDNNNNPNFAFKIRKSK
jgi:hypothetical protein